MGPERQRDVHAKEQFTFAGSSSKTNMDWRTVERTVQATRRVDVPAVHVRRHLQQPVTASRSTTSASTLLPDLATPVLIRVVATDGTDAYLIGRVDGSASLPITLQAFAATSCTDGMLAGAARRSGARSR